MTTGLWVQFRREIIVSSGLIGAVGADTAAEQESLKGGSNSMFLAQDGSNNKIGLFQSAGGSNKASIQQINGGSMSFGAYQSAGAGAGTEIFLSVRQDHGDTATLVQRTTIGSNTATISQLR